MMKKIQTFNPANGELINSYQLMKDHEVEEILHNSVNVQLEWQQRSIKQRTNLLLNLAENLRNNANKYALLITNEMGKPIQQAEKEIEKCAWLCEHYANESEFYLKAKIILTENKKSLVSYRPLGVILGVMPWNFPFWQVFRFAIPSLMAGNTVMVKLAENCYQCSQAISDLFVSAGFPKNTFNNICIDHPAIAKLIADPRVAGVSLTGSEKAGSEIGALAGENLKKVVLELGGNDAYIILDDADLELAAETCLASRLNNTGQVCIAAKRLIVAESVKEQFKSYLLKKLKKYMVGDPLDPKNNLGPLAREDLRANLHKQVVKSVKLGAECLVGGVIPDAKQKGFYYPITVLENITPGMPAYHEELFGPVISIISAQDQDDAIRIANDSKYGLAAAVFTKDIKKGQLLAEQKIHAGTVAVNSLVSSDPRLPFGGIKRSGYGRELSSEGMHEFVNVKTIVIN